MLELLNEPLSEEKVWHSWYHNKVGSRAEPQCTVIPTRAGSGKDWCWDNYLHNILAPLCTRPLHYSTQLYLFTSFPLYKSQILLAYILGYHLDLVFFLLNTLHTANNQNNFLKIGKYHDCLSRLPHPGLNNNFKDTSSLSDKSSGSELELMQIASSDFSVFAVCLNQPAVPTSGQLWLSELSSTIVTWENRFLHN